MSFEIACVGLILSYSCSSQYPPRTDGPQTYATGIVVEEETEVPLANVHVWVPSMGEDWTDEEGGYTVSLGWELRGTVLYAKAGYDTAAFYLPDDMIRDSERPFLWHKDVRMAKQDTTTLYPVFGEETGTEGQLHEE